MPHIAAISVYVDALEPAVEFYTGSLGFTVQSRPAPEIVELGHEGPALVLVQAEHRKAGEYPSGTGVIIGLASSDVGARAEALRKSGVPLIFSEPQPFPGGRFIAARDPAGNVVELLEFTGGKQ